MKDNAKAENRKISNLETFLIVICGCEYGKYESWIYFIYLLISGLLLNTMLNLQEFPFVRYRAAKVLDDASTMTTSRELVPTKLAAAIWNNITTYKSAIPNFPQTETCELLIVDRSIDQVLAIFLIIFFSPPLLVKGFFVILMMNLMLQIAPIIHEWTYDAMCHDMLDLEGSKYVHEVNVFVIFIF